MHTNPNYYQNIIALRQFVTRTYPNLVQLKKEGDQQLFNAELLKIMPEMKKYVNGRLVTAIKKGHFSKGKYKADDIIDQLFIEVHDHIEDVKSENDFYIWLYKKTNELLENIIVDEEYDEFFNKDIEAYTKPEWDEMQESYSTDGDGDFLLIEELDDMSYNHNDYSLKRVFIEDREQDMIKMIDEHLSQEKVQAHITMVLHNLPDAMRVVFELFTKQFLETNEIAQIRNISIEEVEELLKEAKKTIRVSFINRYSLIKNS